MLFQIQSRSTSDPTLSDIDFKIEMAGLPLTFPGNSFRKFLPYGNPRELSLKLFSDIAFYYTREVTNGYLSSARGSAAAINFNVALILFPVCRNLVSFARNLFPGSQLKKIFDANIKVRVFMIQHRD